jgi:hypothetical protein
VVVVMIMGVAVLVILVVMINGVAVLVILVVAMVIFVT